MERRSFVRTLLITAGTLVVLPEGIYSRIPAEKDFLIKMIYNNTGSAAGMENKWGLSVYMEFKEHKLLFDTGGDPEVLRKNIEAAGIDLAGLSTVVISHNHWDHFKGMEHVLNQAKPDLYVVNNDLEEYRQKYPDLLVVGVNSAKEIQPGIWTSGQLFNENARQKIYEQALVLLSGEKCFVFTGCSHPGIIHMLENIRNVHKDKSIELVAGGFHLIMKKENEIQEISEGLKRLGVKKLAASHCTGEPAIQYFKNDWGKDFIDFNLGEMLEL